MAGVLNGFAVIVVLVALGWILARTQVLGHDARLVLNRLVFFVATPALLFDSLARTTLDQVFTGVFVVSAVSAIIVAVLYTAIARMWLHLPASDLVIGALSAGYVNSANLGIPIALYVLGDLGFVMPLLLFQVVVLQPIAIAVLERAQSTGPGSDQPHADGGALKGAFGAIMQAVAKLGLTVRGLYGEGSEAQGDLYQLSNQVTLGRSEEDVIRSLQAATEQIVGHERAMRERAEKKDMYALQDKLLRSWGEAVNARLMSAKELMRRYSDIRYAASMGYLHAPLRALDCMMMDLQPGSLAVQAGKLIGEREGELLRARLMREQLIKLVAD